MIDKDIIMAGAAFIICIAIFVLASIQVKAYAKRPLDYYGNEAMQKVLYATAYRLVTSQMSHIQIYKQNGGIRAPVERKIYEKMQMISCTYTSEQFVTSMKQHGVIDSGMKIRADMCSFVGTELYAYLIRNNFSTMMSGITPEEFFIRRKENPFNVPGVYILFNQTKGKYYVGQATKLSSRINQHFTGHGNGDVYADYKYGDQFLIHWILLAGSGFTDLNALEKHNIAKYNAHDAGYNKTSGNQ